MWDYDFYFTQDGSIGLYSFEDGDVYHSKFGALTEAWVKFVMPAQLHNLLNKKKKIYVLDICYGVGYNTKALMSYILNQNEKKLKNLNFENYYEKNLLNINNIETKYGHNIKNKNKFLLDHIEEIYDDNFSSFIIDCLEIKEELVKISPLLKSNNYKLDIFKIYFPKYYFKLKKILRKNRFLYNLFFKKKIKNKKFITELLNLKFDDDFVNIDEKYKINQFVNPIINIELFKQFKNNRYSDKCKKLLTNYKTKRYFDSNNTRINSSINKNWLIFIYNLIKNRFLHNIYYVYLSNRYKKMNFKLAHSFFKLNFYINDARKSILEIKHEYDLIFLDAFSYTKAPQLWTIEFFNKLYEKLAPNGLLLTYSTSALVRKTLLDNNFYVGKIIDKKSGKIIGTIASKNKKLIKNPLNNYEIGLCNTKAGIPYHDKNFSLTNELIFKMREKDFYESNLMTSSKYKKERNINIGDNND